MNREKVIKDLEECTTAWVIGYYVVGEKIKKKIYEKYI